MEQSLTEASWKDYFPRLTSPLGMLFYSFFVYIVIALIWRLKENYIIPKLEANFDRGINSTILKNRIKKT
jgi:hypothetical protein